MTSAGARAAMFTCQRGTSVAGQPCSDTSGGDILRHAATTSDLREDKRLKKSHMLLSGFKTNPFDAAGLNSASACRPVLP